MTETPMQIPNEKPYYPKANLQKSLERLGLSREDLPVQFNYQMSLALRLLCPLLSGASAEFKKDFFCLAEPSLLEDLLKNFPDSTSGLRLVIQKKIYLVNKGILSIIVASAPNELEEAEVEINQGFFDRENELHLALEFARYRENNTGKYSHFLSLPEKSEVLLDARYKAEVEAIAEDNLKLLAWLQAEAIKGRCLVIFNRRYGANYAGVPLELFLQKIDNIETTEAYVSSTSYDLDDDDKFLWNQVRGVSESLKQQIKDLSIRNVIFVDGTKQNRAFLKKKDELVTRLPRSMRAFELLVSQTGRDLRVWSPSDGWLDKALIGSPNFGQNSVVTPKVETEDPQLNLVSVTAGESAGLFDNPDKVYPEKVLCFGAKGVVESQVARSEKDLVRFVQAEIIKKMKESLS